MSECRKILLVESNQSEAERIKKLLDENQSFESETKIVDRLLSAVSELVSREYDCVLLNMSLTDSHGYNAFTEIKNQNPEIPIFILADAEDEQDAIEAVKDGAWYYLRKQLYTSSQLAKHILNAMAGKEYKEKLKHLQSMNLAVRNINRLIIDIADRNELIKHVCSTLTANRGYKHALIILFDDEGRYIHSASSNLGSRFNKIQSELENGEYPYCWSKVKNTDKAIIIDNPIMECKKCNLADSYLQHPSICARLFYKEHLYGILIVSLSRNITNLDEEMTFLKEISDDISFALNRINLEKLKSIAYVKIKERERQYRKLLENFVGGVMIFAPDTSILMHNKRAARILNVGDEQIQSKMIFDSSWNLYDEDGNIIPIEENPLNKVISEQEVVKNQILEVRRNNNEKSVWLLVNAFPEFSENGELNQVVVNFIDITTFKETEYSSRESRETLKAIFDHAPLAVAKVAPDTRLELTNSAFQEILGYTGEELKSKMIADITHPDDLEKGMRRFRQVMSGEINSYWVEKRYIRKDGGVIWGKLTASSAHDSQGKKFAIVMITDITYRMEAEEALKNSEIKFKNIVESSPLGMHIYKLHDNGELIFVGANPAAESILDFDHTPILGKPINEAFPGLAGTKVPAKYIEVAKNGGVWQNDQINYEKGEIKGVFEVQAFQTSPNTVVAAFQDVTNERLSEIELEKEKERLAVTLRSIGDAVITTDTKFRINLINKVAENLTGWSESEAVGKHLDEVFVIINEKTGQTVANPAKRVIKKGRIVGLANHTLLVSRDGTRRAIADSGSPIMNKKGEIVGVVLAFRDVTKEQIMKDVISRAERLEIAGRLSGQIAHDFNNLLGPLTAYPQIIQDMISENHDVIKYLDRMQDAAFRMAEINQQLLTLSRRGHYNLEPLNLNVLVNHVLEDMEKPEKEFQTEIKLQDGLFTVMGGPSQVFRLISNLIKNAWDAMDDNGRITIRTENYYADKICDKFNRVPRGEYVKLTVSDTGQGIPDNIRSKIFEPFFSTKKSDKKRGSGLGLSIVMTIIEDHNGYLDVRSKIGSGTSFYLYFPCSRETVSESSRKKLILGDGQSVLVVDDDDMQRDVSKSLLEKLNYKVDVSVSGEQAVLIMKEKSYDLMILDMIMPEGIDGAETYRQALQVNPDQKAIIISGYAESDRVELALSLGADGYIRKPVNLYELSLAVDNALKHSKRAEKKVVEISE